MTNKTKRIFEGEVKTSAVTASGKKRYLENSLKLDVIIGNLALGTCLVQSQYLELGALQIDDETYTLKKKKGKGYHIAYDVYEEISDMLVYDKFTMLKIDQLNDEQYQFTLKKSEVTSEGKDTTITVIMTMLSLPKYSRSSGDFDFYRRYENFIKEQMKVANVDVDE